MSSDLVTTVLHRASADPSLTPEARQVILAALEGEDDLARALDPRSSADPDGTTPGSGSGPGPARGQGEPTRAYLSSVTVEGFRGVGPRARLSLTPGPGLVIVAGRNGCGKSSFAEALEVAMTRGSYRWRTRRGVWPESWRNLHRPDLTTIVVELAEEGSGRTVVGARWPAGAELDAMTSWVQRPGAGSVPGLEALGWTRELELFRPFLSYDELGALFAEPSKLYEALASVLGLERLEDARCRLAGARRELAAPKEAAARLARELRSVLSATADERAETMLAQVSRLRPDLDAVRDLVTGTGPGDDGEHSRLRALAVLTGPDTAALDEARARWRSLAATVAGLRADLGTVGTRTTELLAAALHLHRERGDGPCPVCGRGVLDAGWAAEAAAELERGRKAGTALGEACRELRAVERELTSLVPQPPAVLVDAARAAVPGAAAAEVAWRELAALAEEPEALARDGDAAVDRLGERLASASASARAELRRREDAWQPVAVRVAEWLVHAERARRRAARLAAVTAGATWLRANADELRNERIRPLAERARRIWALLRQESNVDLGEVTLAGVTTRRRVVLTASVDGVAAGALGVMSQGELHALALALFLPKASAPASPFGFVVVDDPVQAMDPAKVDGLARVLAEVATGRQVIVFTHDDRLPDAVRRLDLPARLVEITRDRNSVVTVGDVSDPAGRYLDDARAVAGDRAVPDHVRLRVVPELCRMSVEARCRDTYFGHRLREGTPRTVVERAWAAAVGTRAKLALAVRAGTGTRLDVWLAADPRRQAALGVCAAAPHDGLRCDPRAAIRDVARLLRDLGDDRDR